MLLITHSIKGQNGVEATLLLTVLDTILLQTASERCSFRISKGASLRNRL